MLISLHESPVGIAVRGLPHNSDVYDEFVDPFLAAWKYPYWILGIEHKDDVLRYLEDTHSWVPTGPATIRIAALSRFCFNHWISVEGCFGLVQADGFGAVNLVDGVTLIDGQIMCGDESRWQAIIEQGTVFELLATELIADRWCAEPPFGWTVERHPGPPSDEALLLVEREAARAQFLIAAHRGAELDHQLWMLAQHERSSR